MGYVLRFGVYRTLGKHFGLRSIS